MDSHRGTGETAEPAPAEKAAAEAASAVATAELTAGHLVVSSSIGRAVWTASRLVSCLVCHGAAAASVTQRMAAIAVRGSDHR